MGKIIRMPPDPHRETQMLLPWYASGGLDAADRARVEAHLAVCARCRAELADERRLEAEVAKLPIDVDVGWADMVRRIESRQPRKAGLGRWSNWAPFKALRASHAWGGWALAACMTIVLAGVALTWKPTAPAPYHTLAAAAPAVPGDVIVMFRPEAQAGAILRDLEQVRAQVVAGPTSAAAYVLQVPAGARDAALAELRARREVEMAEPLDGAKT